MKSLDESISDDVFAPLADFLQRNPTPIAEYEKAVERFGLPEHINENNAINKKIDYLFEGYVIYSLIRFKKEHKTIHPIKNLEKIYSCETVKRMNWGNYEFKKTKKWKRPTSISALFEYHFYQDDVPIIFEANMNKEQNSKISLKKKIITDILKYQPYFCNIRPRHKNEFPGAYSNEDEKYEREILIEKPKGLQNIL